MSDAPFHPTVLMRSEDSGDQISVIQNRVPGGWAGPPLHHHDFDETFYVLAGELTFQLDERVLTAQAGACIVATRGRHHTLANHHETPASYVLTCTPAVFERYFD